MSKAERIGLILMMIGLMVLVGFICVVAFRDYGVHPNTVGAYIFAQIGLIAGEVYLYRLIHEGGKE